MRYSLLGRCLEGFDKVVSIRRAQSSDSSALFSWRNDPATRAASLNTSEIAWDEHVKWFSVALHNPKIVFYIATNSAVSADSLGMCRFNISDQSDCAEVSINLNPDFRGKGLAQQILHESLVSFSKEFPLVEELTASIKKENLASLKIFLAEGFTSHASFAGVEYLVFKPKS